MLDPGLGARVQVDLREFLEQTSARSGGEVTFTVRFRGSSALVKGTPNLWNPDSTEVLESAPIQIEIRRPEWLTQITGSTDVAPDAEDGDEAEMEISAIESEVYNTVLTYNPRAPDAQERLDKMLAGGEPTLATLCHLTEWMAHLDAEDAMQGGRALTMVVQAGEPARKILRKAASSSHPARDMALAVLDVSARRRESRKMPPELDTLKSVAAGGAEGAFLHVEVTGGTQPASYIVDSRGVLTRRRTTPKGNESASKQLTSDDVLKLKRALVESRMWCWRAVRTETLEGEGEVRFRVVPGAPDGVSVDVTLREREAREVNPFSRKVMAALGAICTNMESKRD